jgi:hypothetical protein
MPAMEKELNMAGLMERVKERRARRRSVREERQKRRAVDPRAGVLQGRKDNQSKIWEQHGP